MPVGVVGKKTMPPLHFNLPILEFLASHRTPLLTQFFLAVSALGNLYTVIITLIYVAWNKKVAIRLAVLMSLTSSLNILLKLIIKNPRPFVLEGTYLKKWAVSPQAARSLALEDSTPSGHAMAAASFYLYLFALVRNGYFRAFAIAAIVLIGFSRPYLGVHYVEDVLLGWAAGLGCSLLAVKYCTAIGRIWSRFSYPIQVGIAVVFSLVLCLLSFVINGGALGQPSEILSDAGFLAGVLIAYPLERRLVNFDPQSSSLLAKALRLLLTVCLFGCTSLLLTKAIAGISNMPALPGFLLQYLRFTAEGFAVIFLAPLLFTRMGLADSAPVSAD
jgi:membrane-associated phospholipid phosphatase